MVRLVHQLSTRRAFVLRSAAYAIQSLEAAIGYLGWRWVFIIEGFRSISSKFWCAGLKWKHDDFGCYLASCHCILLKLSAASTTLVSGEPRARTRPSAARSFKGHCFRTLRFITALLSPILPSETDEGARAIILLAEMEPCSLCRSARFLDWRFFLVGCLPISRVENISPLV